MPKNSNSPNDVVNAVLHMSFEAVFDKLSTLSRWRLRVDFPLLTAGNL